MGKMSMFAPILFVGLIASGLNPPAAIPRVIVKEPVYDGKPRYALLVFGKEAKTRIWIVRDDKWLYVDRNGNGDLTEPGEKLPVGNVVDQIVEQDGTIHKNLYLYTMNDGKFRMRLGNNNRNARTQFVGWGRMETPTFGNRPDNAPIIHFNGPMTLDRYGPIYTFPRGDGGNRAYKLRLLVGTPGLGAGTFASFSDLCSEKLGNLQADIDYPHPTKPGETFRQRVELVHDG
jgi:hypothetical protein